MFDDIAYLCKETITQDEYLNEKHTLTPTEVFARPRSIGTGEFYHAATTDYHPEVKLVLADFHDYDGQEIVMYNRHMFDVIRTFRNGDRLELTLQERMGKPEDWMWDPFNFLDGVIE